MSSIKLKKKICIRCQKETYLFAKKLCRSCYNYVATIKKRDDDKEHKKSPKLKPVKRKPNPKKKTYIRKATGELEVFKKIWKERPHICQVTGQALTVDNVNFSHILPKGRYPKFRLREENIWLVTWEIHHQWEHGNRLDPMFDKKRELRSILKHRYHEEFN